MECYLTIIIILLLLEKFFQLLYAISTFRFFINENSKVNAMYGVFVITALSGYFWAYPINTAILGGAH